MINFKYISSLTKNEAKVLASINDNLINFEKFDIESVANSSLTSISTLSRIYKKIGFSSYSEFKFFLIDEQNKLLHVETEYNNTLKDNLIYFLDNIDDSKINFLCEAISSAREVYIVAVGQSKLIAKYLQMNFEIAEKNMYVISESHMISKIGKLVHDDSLLIVISASGSTQTICNSISELNKSFLASNCISLTSNQGTMLSSIIKNQFTLTTSKNVNLGIDIYSRGIYFIFVDILFQQYITTTLECGIATKK